MSSGQPNFAEFKRLAGQANVVPVYRAIVADMLSPVAAFLKLTAGNESSSPQGRKGGSEARPYSFLLESVEGGEHVGRYTFFGADPFQIVRCRGERITVERGRHSTSAHGPERETKGERREESGNVFDFLRRASAPYRSAALPGLPPFTVGAVGYLSYETVRQLERLPARVPPDVEMDDAVFLYFANLAAFDHVQHRLFLISNVLTEEGSGSLQAKYHAALRELDRMERRLARPLGLPRFRRPHGALRVRSNLTRERYEQIVGLGKEYIRAGDVFQVVL